MKTQKIEPEAIKYEKLTRNVSTYAQGDMKVTVTSYVDGPRLTIPNSTFTVDAANKLRELLSHILTNHATS